MSVAAASARVVLRQTIQLSRRSALRFNSSAAKATEAAKETASKAADKTSEIKSKASEGLSRVTTSAGPALSRAVNGILKSLGKIGGRTGKVVALIERAIPPTIFYARVGLELGQLIFKGRNMSFPPVKVWEQYYTQTLELFKTRTLLLQYASNFNLASRLRSLNTAQIAGGAVIGAELIGFFTVGEIIGKMKLVGYRGPVDSHH